jgi:NAD(P)H dehydrogenase (quinone)
MRIAIVYDSGYGHTARLAQSVAKGAASVPGTSVMEVAVSEPSIPWAELEACDAIIFGSPTYNGMLSARMKQFFEDSTRTAWNDYKWRNKLAAGFTNSGAHSGDKLNVLMSFSLFAAQHGMIWVGLDLKPGNSASTGSADELNRLGSWLGAMAQSNVDQGAEAIVESDLLTAEHLGRRVASITLSVADSKLG